MVKKTNILVNSEETEKSQEISVPPICIYDLIVVLIRRDKYHTYWLAAFDPKYDPYEIIDDPSDQYNTFSVLKRSGGRRQIDAPSYQLKIIQRWILENVLYALPCSKYAKAYIKGRSITDNAKYHERRKLVVVLDVKNYFNSIKAYHVYNLFKDTFQYSEREAVLLTNLCVYNGYLPQGAPTSGYLSNLILRRFDEIVGNYCRDHSICYTRYADDLTFSGDFDIAALIFLVKHELGRLGLTLNKKKVKVMRGNRRQTTTGIVLNEKKQVPRQYRMKIRQEIHYIYKYGLVSHLQHIGRDDKSSYLRHLAGKIQYVLSIQDNERMEKYLKYVKALMVLEEISLQSL